LRHSVSPELLRLLPEYVRWADVVHLTAVYNFPTFPTFAAARRYGKPVVLSPRGALQRWAGSKRPVLKSLWERLTREIAPDSVVLHVTSEQEKIESLQRFPDFRAEVIPNGIEIPPVVAHENGEGSLRLLFIGRIDPKKGIENLLDACAQLSIPWSLTIAGAGDAAYVETIRQRIEGLQMSDRVRMVGEVLEDDKEAVFRNADLCVVPSFTENFAIVVAEALARAVPVIASHGTPWGEVEKKACGMWVDNSAASLAAAITQLHSAPLREMGERGRTWMEREFSWESVGARMLALYEEVIGNGGNVAAESRDAIVVPSTLW
jgi:glycosyltransferase involved in cell wall biosynthesis